MSTWGRLAGNESGLPMSPSFPAAATTSMPLRIAVSIACWIGSGGPLGAEAQVDHAGALVRGGEHAGDDVARLERRPRPERGIPRLEQRLGIDADHADVVWRVRR